MIMLGIMIALLIIIFLFGAYEIMNAPLMDEDYEEDDYDELYSLYYDELTDEEDEK